MEKIFLANALHLSLPEQNDSNEKMCVISDLHEEHSAHNYVHANIFNVDESGLTVNQENIQKSQHLLANVRLIGSGFFIRAISVSTGEKRFASIITFRPLSFPNFSTSANT